MKKYPISIWLYIYSSKNWWRTVGSYMPKNGKIFKNKDKICDKCCKECLVAYEVNDNNIFYCSDCFIYIKSVDFEIYKLLFEREIGKSNKSKILYNFNNFIY